MLTYVALFLIMAPAAWLLLGVLAQRLPHWQWSVLWTTLTPTGGGLRDQILGTLILMLGVFIIAGTIGVLAGIHLAELARPGERSGKVSGPLRTASDILSGFPSIVLGYVGYMALVVGLHWGFSLLPALIILSIMVIPYIAKNTETSLRQVPTGYREGAEALGMSMGYGLRKVILKSALPGIVTGLLLALAIACGETAPLIYTAGFATTLPHSLTQRQFPYLTYVVFRTTTPPRRSTTTWPSTRPSSSWSSSCSCSSRAASSWPAPSGTPRVPGAPGASRRWRRQPFDLTDLPR